VVDVEPDPVGARRMSRVLVTGGGGQLAADLVAAWPDAEVVAPPRRELDVTDAGAVDQLVQEVAPELVLHAAAWTDVDGAEAEPEGALAVNRDGSANVAAAAHRAGARLVAFSTDYVFDGDDPDGYVESSPTRPRSVYGRTKLAGEEAAREAHPEAYIARTAWVFSPRGRNFVRTMLRLGAEREVLTVVDDQRGCPTYTGHLAAATRALLDACPPGTYHLAGAGSCSWYELAAATIAAAGLAARIEPMSSADLDRPAPRPACSVLRTEHACTPRLPDWRQGLATCLEAMST
jgi:dTDP-4-dehydrorhamnose reductase